MKDSPEDIGSMIDDRDLETPIYSKSLYLVTKTVEAYVSASSEHEAEELMRWGGVDEDQSDVDIIATKAKPKWIPQRWLGALPFGEDREDQRTIRQLLDDEKASDSKGVVGSTP